jgi:hypothetical protein
VQGHNATFASGGITIIIPSSCHLSVSVFVNKLLLPDKYGEWGVPVTELLHKNLQRAFALLR